MGTVYVFLADGLEEIEAVTPIDVLRRAGVTVTTVGISGKRVVGAHSIPIEADVDGREFHLPEDAAMVVLPGGGEGTENLAASEVVQDALEKAAAKKLYIAAICAAPTVLHKYGLLRGKTVTAFPTNQPSLTGATVTGSAVEVDGNIITARSAGVALQFSHALVQLLAGKEKADTVVQNLYPAV